MSAEIQKLQGEFQELQGKFQELLALFQEPEYVLTVIGLIIFFAGLPIWFRKRRTIGLRGERILENAKANGCVVTGYLVNYKFLCGDPSEQKLRYRRDRHIATYSYELGGKFHKFKYHGGRTKPPETISLYYDPKRPRKVFTNGIRNQRGAKYLLWALYPATGWFMVPAILMLIYFIFTGRSPA